MSKKKQAEDMLGLGTGNAPTEMLAEGKNGGDCKPVELSEASVERLAAAIADALCSRLVAMLPIHARLTSADTIHTTLRPDTVFRHAIREAAVAQQELDKHFRQNASAE